MDARTDLLRALAEEHGPALWRYVVRLTGSAALADDVVQETLLRAWRRPEVLDQSESSARAWLFTVARHLVIDERRSAHARHEIGTDELPERGQRRPDRRASRLLADRGRAGMRCRRNIAPSSSAPTTGGSRSPKPRGCWTSRHGTVKSRLHYALRAMRLALQERGVTER